MFRFIQNSQRGGVLSAIAIVHSYLLNSVEVVKRLAGRM
jgi:hypothetical protein